MQFTWLIPSLIFGLFLGFTAGVWHLFVMSAVTALLWPLINRYKARIRDPDLEVRIESGRAFIGDRKLPRAQILWRRNWQELVNQYLLDESELRNNQLLLESRKRHKFSPANQFGTWLGVSQNADLELDLPSQGPHLILIGPTGAGKSELLKNLVSSLLEAKGEPESAGGAGVSSNDRLLYLIDFKGGATFNRYASHNRVKSVVTDLTDGGIGPVLQWLNLELDNRERVLAAAGQPDIERFLATKNNLSFNGERQPDMPRLFVFIDELSAFFQIGAPAIATVESVASRGRSLGVHLICASQSLVGIPRSVLVNIRARIAVGPADQIELLQLGATGGQSPSKEILAGWRSAALIHVGQAPLMFQFPIGTVK